MKRLLSMALCIAMLLTLIPAGYAEVIRIIEIDEEQEIGLDMPEDEGMLPSTEDLITLAEQESEPLDLRPEALAQDVAYHVTDTVSAVLSVDGVLTISGTGEIPDFQPYQSPWYYEIKYISSVVVDDGITAIGNNCFYNCKKLTAADIADSVETIGDGAFARTALTDLSGMNGVQVIDSKAFQECKLESFRFPDAVQSIGENVFSNCTELKTISISASLVQIGSLGSGLGALERIDVDAGNPAFLSMDGVLLTKDGTELLLYPQAKSGESYAVPDGVTVIKAYAFSGQANLNTVTLPATLSSIEDRAFSAIPNLGSFEIPAGVTTLGTYVLQNCGKLESLTIRAQTESFGVRVADGCGSLTTVIFDTETMNSIETFAFADCSSLRTLVLPAALKTINYRAFYNCSSLTEVDFPETVTFIHSQAFENTGVTDFPHRLHRIENGNYYLLAEITVSGTYHYEAAYQVLEIVNQERENAGLEPLSMDSEMQEIAMLRAAECAVLFSHARPNGQLCFTAHQQMKAENIASGYASPEAVMEGWMNSSGHRGNIRDPQAKSVGIGCIVTQTGIYWTQCFSAKEIEEPYSLPDNRAVDETVLAAPAYLTEENLSLTASSSGDTEEPIRTVILYSNRYPVEAAFFNFSSDRPETASVSEEGVVQRLGSGDFTITAVMKYDPFTVLSLDFSEHDWGEPTYTWAEDYSTVTATRICKNDASHVETETVETTSAVTTAASCEEDGVRTYTAVFTNAAFAMQTKTEAIPATGHTPGEPVRENEVAAACETEGGYDTVIYCTVCGEELSREHTVIPATGHNWDESTYVWAEDNSNVTATVICKNDASHIETETVNTTSEVTTPATCEEDGVRTYIAEFTNEAFATQTKTEVIPATGHTPGEPVKENEVAATCETDGSYDTVIYCTVCGEELSREHTTIPATGHDWDPPTYVWAEDNGTVTATRICKNDAEHVETETVNTTSEVTTPATCEEDGVRTYTATFTNTAFVTQTKTEAIPATGHTPGEPVRENEVAATCETDGSYDTVVYCTVCGEELSREHTVITATGHDWDEATYVWAEDNSTVTATVVCKNDAEHVLTETAETTYEVITEPTTQEEGLGRFTAVFENELFTTQIKDVAIEKVPYPELTEAFNSATGVRVSWKAVPGAVKYQLLRKNLTKGETAWTVIGETTELTLIDTTVASASRYTFTVQAIDADGVISERDETGRTCTYIAKADITNLLYGVNGVSITWSKPAGAKNFRVMRSVDGTSTWTVLAVIEGTTYTDTTAKIGTKYWYTVRGVSMDNKVLINSYNGTGWSIKPLSTPVLTEAFNSATGVRVSWKAVDGAAKYRLLRKDVNAGTGWETIGTTAACTLIDTSAKSASRYTYTVECVDSNGRTCSSSDSTGRTCTFIALAKITSIKSVSNGVALEWSKPAGAKNFRVFRKTDGGAWVAIKDVMGTSFVDTTAVKGVKYWYTVRAITLAGDMYINSYNATGWSVTRK